MSEEACEEIRERVVGTATGAATSWCRSGSWSSFEDKGVGGAELNASGPGVGGIERIEACESAASERDDAEEAVESGRVVGTRLSPSMGWSSSCGEVGAFVGGGRTRSDWVRGGEGMEACGACC
jgi:hypothetical protein